MTPSQRQRCSCRCDGVISLSDTGEAVACEAVCCLPRGHEGGTHACPRHDLARLANARRGVQAAEEARALQTGRLGEMLSSKAGTLEQLEEEAERAVNERDLEERSTA
eukprot:15324463-Alexandrium_andersonii.AAC.1